MQRKKTLITILVVAAALVLLFFGVRTFSESPNGRPGANSKENQPVPVEVNELQTQEFADTMMVNGEIQPTSTVQVFAETQGELVELSASQGDRVERGQVIGSVDPSSPGQRYAASPIEAPISGTIVSLEARIGSQISPETPIASIATTDELEIIAHVPERYISRIRHGQPADIRLDAVPGQEFTAQVTQISPIIDAESRTLRIELEFDRNNEQIVPGMFPRIRLITEERGDALVVPQNAVLRRDGESFVYVVEESDANSETDDNPESANEDETDDQTVQLRAQERPVEIGIEADGKAELRSGVSAGEKVVIRGQHLLEPDREVRIIGGKD